MNKENKKKIIFIAVLAIILVGGIFLIQVLQSEEEPNTSEEFSTPESQRQAYNSKIEAYNTDKQTVNMGTFEDNFKVSKETTKEKETQSKDDGGLFNAIDRQIANMGREEKEAEKPREEPRKEVQTSKPTGGGSGTRIATKKVSNEIVSQEEPPKKSRRQLREERLEQEQKANQFEEVDNLVQQQMPKNTPRRKVGQKLTFEDLPETEQRRILLQTGQRTYQESSEISAKIISTGEVKAGQAVRLMLQEKAVLSFKVIPSGTIISGTVGFDQNRMKINFSTIRLKNEIIKVNLDLYAMDGLLGLPITGESHTEEAENEGLDEAVSRTGRVGRIAGSVVKSLKSSKKQGVNLGNNVACILVNNNVNE